MAGRTRDTGLDDHLFSQVRTYASATSFKARGLGIARVHRHCSKNLRARDLRTYVRTPLWARQTGSCHGSSLSCIKGTCGFLFRAPNLVFGPRSGAAASKIFLLYSRQLSMS